jgi:hypothetical protein
MSVYIDGEHSSKSMDSTFSLLPRAFPDVSPITGPAIDLGLSYEEGYDDPVYQAKARILNHAIQDIGMGRYQVSSYSDGLSISIEGVWNSGISSW